MIRSADGVNNAGLTRCRAREREREREREVEREVERERGGGRAREEGRVKTFQSTWPRWPVDEEDSYF